MTHDPTPPRQTAKPASPPKVLSAAALLDGRNEVAIEFHGQVYRLRATRQGKLILTK